MQKMYQTVLEAILASLQAAGDYNQNDQVAPAAILWTDKDRQWEPLLPRLRQLLPQLLTLGAYDPANRTIWASNESSGSETIIDAATGAPRGTVRLGGEAGNVAYDPASGHILVGVQGRNQLAVIDPAEAEAFPAQRVHGALEAHARIEKPLPGSARDDERQRHRVEEDGPETGLRTDLLVDQDGESQTQRQKTDALGSSVASTSRGRSI